MANDLALGILQVPSQNSAAVSQRVGSEKQCSKCDKVNNSARLVGLLLIGTTVRKLRPPLNIARHTTSLLASFYYSFS